MTETTENTGAIANGVSQTPPAAFVPNNSGMSTQDQAIAFLRAKYPDANPVASLMEEPRQTELEIQGDEPPSEKPIDKPKAKVAEEPVSDEDEFLRAFGDNSKTLEEDDSEELPSKITLEDLANQYKTTPQELLNKLIVKTKVNDVENDLPLSDVLRGYQTDKSVTERSQALAAKEKEIEALRQDFSKRQQDLNQSLNTANEMVNHYYKELEREYTSINWEQIREEDESRYNTLRLDYYQKRQNLDNYVAKISAEFQKQQQQLNIDEQNRRQQEAYEMQQNMLRQQQRMFELMPELKEEKTRKVFQNTIEDALSNFYGFSREEFNSNVFQDARVMPIIRDAVLWRRMKEGNVKDKMVKAPPKVIKPQARGTRDEQMNANLKNLRDAAFAKKDEASAIAYLKAAGIRL